MEIQLREGVGTVGHRQYWVKNQEAGGPVGTVSFVTLGKSLDFNEFYDYALMCFFMSIKNKFNKDRKTIQTRGVKAPGQPRNPHLPQEESLDSWKEGQWACSSDDPAHSDVEANC